MCKERKLAALAMSLRLFIHPVLILSGTTAVPAYDEVLTQLTVGAFDTLLHDAGTYVIPCK